jgi:hypothetical protein
VGEAKVIVEKFTTMETEEDDTSCGYVEEGQDGKETQDPAQSGEKKGSLPA